MNLSMEAEQSTGEHIVLETKARKPRKKKAELIHEAAQEAFRRGFEAGAGEGKEIGIAGIIAGAVSGSMMTAIAVKLWFMLH